MKKKLLIIVTAAALTFALLPQAAFGASSVSFSDRPVIKAETTGQRTDQSQLDQGQRGERLRALSRAAGQGISEDQNGEICIFINLCG